MAERTTALYHFTQLRRGTDIAAFGVTDGGLPIQLPYGTWAMVPGFQWLTEDPDWRAQGWNTNHDGAIEDRTELRFTIVIPRGFRQGLKRWNAFALTVLRLPEATLQAFNAEGGSLWWLYQGAIVAEWITDCERRPSGILHALGRTRQ